MVKIREKSELQSSSERIIQLQKELRELWRARQAEVNDQWVRTLPFADYVVDRWEKARVLGFGTESSIYDSSVVIGEVRVGEHTWIGPFTLLDGSGGLNIGSFCSISAGVKLYSHDTIKWALSGGKAKYGYASTKIGDCCFIGTHSTITKGVTIGKHCLVSAGSVVSKDILEYSIVAGCPAKKIGEVQINTDGKIHLNYFHRKKIEFSF